MTVSYNSHVRKAWKLIQMKREWSQIAKWFIGARKYYTVYQYLILKVYFSQMEFDVTARKWKKMLWLADR